MFVSNAQNFEDVILWRALQGVEKGFYIDIGANDPDVHSVSKAFHERGWSGISVEPESRFAELLRRRRPSETVIEAAVGPATETAVLFSIDGTGLSTLDLEIAKAHAPTYEVVTRVVKVLTLDRLLDMAEDEVHWLKVDVEGFEEAVINSWQISRKRPWIVVVESVNPVTLQRNVGNWGASLAEKGYSFAYFDGLNDFYVHESHVDLMERFSAPPNVFDRFVLVEDSEFCRLANMRSQSEAARLKHVIEEQAAQATAAEADRDALNAEVANIRAELARREAELTRTIDEQTARAKAAEADRDAVNAEIGNIRAKLVKREAESTQTIDRHQRELARLQHVIDERSRWSRAAIAHQGLLAAELDDIRRSTSWRITAPLRSAMISVHLIGAEARRLPTMVISRAAYLVRVRYPWLSQRIKALPRLRKIIVAVAGVPVATNRAGTSASVSLKVSPTPASVALSSATVGATTLSLLLDRMRPWTFGARWNA
jgi:FkbM family methyltransferase